MLSFDRSALDGVPAEAMAAALDAGRRGRDLVVVDLPRRFDEPSLLALTAADRAYLVVPAELRACAAARRVAAVAAGHCAGAVAWWFGGRPRSACAPTEIAQALDLPLAGALRSEPRLAAGAGGRAAAGRAPGAVRWPSCAATCWRTSSPRRHRVVAR